jgi:hypothetical protein
MTELTMDEFRQFMSRIGVDWEQPEPTALGHCFEVPPMTVYFSDTEIYMSSQIHDDDNEEDWKDGQ